MARRRQRRRTPPECLRTAASGREAAIRGGTPAADAASVTVGTALLLAERDPRIPRTAYGLAGRIGEPVARVRAALAQLRRAGIARRRGRDWDLARPPAAVTLASVLTAAATPAGGAARHCRLLGVTCSSAPECTLNAAWRRADAQRLRLLGRVTLASAAHAQLAAASAGDRRIDG